MGGKGQRHTPVCVSKLAAGNRARLSRPTCAAAPRVRNFRKNTVHLCATKIGARELAVSLLHILDINPITTPPPIFMIHCKQQFCNCNTTRVVYRIKGGIGREIYADTINQPELKLHKSGYSSRERTAGGCPGWRIQSGQTFSGLQANIPPPTTLNCQTER